MAHGRKRQRGLLVALSLKRKHVAVKGVSGSPFEPNGVASPDKGNCNSRMCSSSILILSEDLPALG